MAKIEKKKATQAKNKEPKKTIESAKKAETKKVVKQETPKTEGKAAVKEAPKAIAAKAEPKKITAKEEAKKLTTAKAPEKIATKPEPKKIEEKKPVAKAEAVKKESVKAEPVKPVATKEEKVIAKPAKKAATKKTTAKKATSAEPTAPLKEAAPKAVKAAPVKEEKTVETKPAKEKKATETKQTKKPAAKKATTKKATAKKPVAKKIDQAKLDHYQTLPLEECIRLMQTMQVNYDYEDYYRLLLAEADYALLEKNIIEGNKITEQNYRFDEIGCDADLVLITLQKVGETMDIKAADYKELKKAINHALKFVMGEDGETNAAEYLDEFKLSEKLLMIGQRRDIFTAAEVASLIDADVVAYFKHFFDFAYALLPEWQYNDVKFYEDFAYAVLSQFADLYETEQLRIQIDVADLYIKHGDYSHGDEMYGYILRDNQIKDYIYYRYASVYKDVDYNKAKSIAYSSLQYVDDRYSYYPNIMEIINQ